MTVQKKPVEAEATADNDDVVVSVGDFKFSIRPRGKWRISAVEALREGRYTDWARGAMTTESYDEWLDADLTQDEVEELFRNWAEETGQGKALSRAQRRASNSSRKN